MANKSLTRLTYAEMPIPQSDRKQRLVLLEVAGKEYGFAYCPSHGSYFSTDQKRLNRVKADVQGNKVNILEFGRPEELTLVKRLVSATEASDGSEVRRYPKRDGAIKRKLSLLSICLTLST